MEDNKSTMQMSDWFGTWLWAYRFLYTPMEVNVMFQNSVKGAAGVAVGNHENNRGYRQVKSNKESDEVMVVAGNLFFIQISKVLSLREVKSEESF